MEMALVFLAGMVAGALLIWLVLEVLYRIEKRREALTHTHTNYVTGQTYTHTHRWYSGKERDVVHRHTHGRGRYWEFSR